MRRRLILLGVLVLVVAVLWQVGRILWVGGAFRSITPHFAGSCRRVAGPVGAEDVTIHPRRSVAFLSASDRRAVAAGAPTPGAIWAYDLDATDAAPVNLTPDADTTFQPHGLSLWVDDEGPDVLFAVNHAPLPEGREHHSIEIFDVEETRLVHRASLTDPLLVMPNDLVAVARDRFYVTNTHRHPPGLLQTVETYLMLSGAQVLFYGPGGFRPAIDGLVLPNGINRSADGRTLYVAGVTPRNLLVYDRDPETDTLTRRDEVFLATGPDNIEVEADGTLWIAAHPKLLQLTAHMEDATELAPSQVLRVRERADGGYRVDEVYLNDGSELPAATVAAVQGTRLLMGAVSAEGFLDCTRRDASTVTPPAPTGARPSSPPSPPE